MEPKKKSRKKRHLQINKKEKIKRRKHVWLSGRLHIEGRLNEGLRFQRKRRWQQYVREIRDKFSDVEWFFAILKAMTTD